MSTPIFQKIVKILKLFLNDIFSSFLTKKGLISKKLILKMGMVFGLGAMLAFIAAVFALTLKDIAEVKRRKKQLMSIKKNNVEGK